MNWILLIIAGCFEVAFATCLGKAKETSGTTATLWIIGFFITLSISMALLYKASQTLPIGTAYAVWTGIGAVGTVVLVVEDVDRIRADLEGHVAHDLEVLGGGQVKLLGPDRVRWRGRHDQRRHRRGYH